MKTAKQLFSELGYEYNKFNRTIVYKKKNNDDEYYKDDTVMFCSLHKIYEVRSGWEKWVMPIDEVNFEINIKLHQAIHQQMNELNWL